MDICDAFEAPGVPVEAEVYARTHRIVASSEATGLFGVSAEGLPLDEAEIPAPNGEHASWVALGGRFRAVAEALGGQMVLESYVGSMGERHTVRFLGDKVEV